MATAGHVLTATDAALKAFFVAAAITDLPAANIVRNKEVSDKGLPILICATDTAERGRAKNWKVTGSLILKTDITDDDGVITAAQLAASTAMESALVDAMEILIPNDDRPQPLADGITAAAVTAAVVLAAEFMMTGFFITRISAGFDDDSIWTCSVDFTATVIA